MAKRDSNGRFVKGASPNPKGRPKGSKNRTTKELREAVEQLLSDNWEQLIDDLKELEPRERVAAMIRLLEYALPKLNRTEAEVKVAEQPTFKGWDFLPGGQASRLDDDDER